MFIHILNQLSKVSMISSSTSTTVPAGNSAEVVGSCLESQDNISLDFLNAFIFWDHKRNSTNDVIYSDGDR